MNRDELVEIGLRAAHPHPLHPAVMEDMAREMVTRVIDAVEPLIHAAVAEDIAQAIEAHPIGCPFEDCMCSGARMKRDAAAIARSFKEDRDD